MNKFWTLPPKSPLRSKAIWAAILTGTLGVYEAVVETQGGPHVPIWVYTILGSVGLYGLRTADRPVKWGAEKEEQAQGQPDTAPQRDPPVVSVVVATPTAPTLPDAAASLPDAAAPLPLMGPPPVADGKGRDL